MAKNDEVFIDEDSGLPAILDHMGHKRPLGFIPQTDPARMMAVPAYRDTVDLIPEKDWDEFDDFPVDIIKVKDQNGFGACNGHAAATGVEVARYVAGMPHVPISAWYIYAILCNGRDAGSMIGDALKLLEGKGAAPEDDVQYGIINPRKLTEKAHADAPRYKAEIGASLTTYEELGTAIARRQPINLAVCVGAGFNNLDADDVPRIGMGPCNHAVFVGLKLKRRSNGEVLGGMVNSWTESWGRKGRCNLPLAKVVRAAYFEAYTLRAVVDDTTDTSKPPPILIA